MDDPSLFVSAPLSDDDYNNGVTVCYKVALRLKNEAVAFCQ